MTWRRDALLQFHRGTVGICCWVLLSHLALQAMYLDGLRRIEQSQTDIVPAWWMLLSVVLPMIVAVFVATRVRRPPTRVIIAAGAVFWIAYLSLILIGDGLDPEGAVRAWAPMGLTGVFLATAAVSRR